MITWLARRDNVRRTRGGWLQKQILMLACGVAAMAGNVALVRAQAPAAIIAIRAARLFDGTSDSTIADAVVLVQGSRIAAKGSRLAIPAGARVVDLGDATILPGFIDAHTHVTGESSDDWNADTVAGLRRTIPKRRCAPPSSRGGP